jgi:hypothetical protein
MGSLFILVAIICLAASVCWGCFYVVHEYLIGYNSKSALS